MPEYDQIKDPLLNRCMNGAPRPEGVVVIPTQIMAEQEDGESYAACLKAIGLKSDPGRALTFGVNTLGFNWAVICLNGEPTLKVEHTDRTGKLTSYSRLIDALPGSDESSVREKLLIQYDWKGSLKPPL